MQLVKVGTLEDPPRPKPTTWVRISGISLEMNRLDVRVALKEALQDDGRMNRSFGRRNIKVMVPYSWDTVR